MTVAVPAAPSSSAALRRVVVVGRENVGKSELAASLTGAPSRGGAFMGSTIACEAYRCEGWEFLDTPGIFRVSDAETTQRSLAELRSADVVLLVASAASLDEDLAEMLPLVAGKRGAAVVTFRDCAREKPELDQALAAVFAEAGVPFHYVDARRLSPAERAETFRSLEEPGRFAGPVRRKVSWRLEPRLGPLEYGLVGRILSLLLLMLPAGLAVAWANATAEGLQPWVQARLAPWVEWFKAGGGPAVLRELAVGDYGLLTMGPLLFVWAVPTVFLFAFILAFYKASGLVDRISASLHPWTTAVGLSGRDLVRVVMGFGCNVPAVVSTRACSSCTRGACVSAVAFGAACSYQLPATLAVFAAAGRSWLALPFLAYLACTTLLYVRWASDPQGRSLQNRIVVERRTFLVAPRAAAVWREARGVLRQFFAEALPVFVLMSAAASLLHFSGLLKTLVQAASPLAACFDLPSSAALPLVMASIRKDGILMLLPPADAAAGAGVDLSSVQLLAATYLAGVLVPCLATVWVVAREQGAAFAGRMLLRQAAAAVAFTLILAWGGKLLF